MSEIKKMLQEIKNNQNLLQKFNPEQLEYLENKANETHPILDKRIFMIVVKIVGLALLLSIIFASLMIFVKDKPVDDFFIMIASACIGALAGLLVPTPSN